MGKIKSCTIFCLCIAILALTLSFGPVLEQNTSAAATLKPTAPTDVLIWQVLPSQPLVAEKSFSLYTAQPAKYVVYGHREYGINLVWSVTQPDNFILEKFGKKSGPINYGDIVALKERTGGYIYYKRRKYGINLEFSTTPVYEWTVHGGNAGTPIVPRNWGDSAGNISDVKISLFNYTARCYVVYGSREYGINLVWKGGQNC